MDEFQQLFIDFNNATHDDRMDMADTVVEWREHAKARIAEIHELQHHDLVDKIKKDLNPIIQELTALRNNAIDGTLFHYNNAFKIWSESLPEYPETRRQRWNELQHQTRNLHTK